ncbi:hypothetical protein [Thalassomonas haliotis]|uniref:DUF304 domain-containing protein n=1 Tax=Thalassomonas haliotis TaxID=485448 RepID=A0ABY7V8N4_9GAMM|nr:hypothetical protein [Thalassomonas haliotis]WDE10009.1 hypothetical protein H3N35_17085 [Thalassomonas haliotis]
MHYREKYALIRERWDKEDSLLLLRTGIFLTLNSVLLAAAQLNNSGDFKIFIIAFAIVFSSLWLITSLHTYRIIKRLYQKCHRLMPNEIKGIYKVKVWVRPNRQAGTSINLFWQASGDIHKLIFTPRKYHTNYKKQWELTYSN